MQQSDNHNTISLYIIGLKSSSALSARGSVQFRHRMAMAGNAWIIALAVPSKFVCHKQHMVIKFAMDCLQGWRCSQKPGTTLSSVVEAEPKADTCHICHVSALRLRRSTHSRTHRASCSAVLMPLLTLHPAQCLLIAWCACASGHSLARLHLLQSTAAVIFLQCCLCTWLSADVEIRVQIL